MKNLVLKLKKYFRNYDWKIITKVVTFLLLLFLITFDQLIKLIARKNLSINVEYHFLPGFINFQYVINYGSAFGLNQNKTVFLITFAFMIIFVLLIWWFFNKSTTIAIALVFILGGTTGNLIDRFLHDGGVIDFLKWDMFNPKTVLNPADIMVTIGIIIFVTYFIIEGIKSITYERKEHKMEKKNNAKVKRTV